MRKWKAALRADVATALLLALAACQSAAAAQPGEYRADVAAGENMRLVGYSDLQARSAYHPVIQRQGDRYIAYIGHHGGTDEIPQPVNPMTGRKENNGTSIVDVTDPRHPRYLAHLPGRLGLGERGGAQMVRVCDGRQLPKGDPSKVYLLRTDGGEGHQVWDVTAPEKPVLVTQVLTGLKDTHKNWWECDTGIAYLISDGRPEGWRSSRITKIYDLSDPANPRFIRNFSVPGHEPGSKVEPVPQGVHGPIAVGNRVYFGYGTSRGGIIQIVDRDKLLKGDPAAKDPFAPTVANLLYPQIGRLDLYPTVGAHTVFPVLGMEVTDFSKNTRGHKRDFLVVVNESTANECQEDRQMMFMVDITHESTPFAVSNFNVPDASGDFCRRGGRFGTHASNESFAPVYYRKLVFLAYFNAGVRAVDIRDPFAPREVAHYIPAITNNTAQRCVKTVEGGSRCKTAIQTNNLEVDDRGYIYIVDRANTGMHILELTGEARKVADLK